VLVRPKTDDDEVPCVALMRQTHEADGYPRYWPAEPHRFLRPRQETDAWVAEADGALVGHVALHDARNHPILPAAQRATGLPAERLAVVARLLVSPAAQGRGVGRQLLSAAVGHAHGENRRPVLDVVQESTAAISFYEKAGWTRLEPLTLELDGSTPDEPMGFPPLQMWVYLAPAVAASA
jgi:GNAT superfamily N-acetyltransferase